MLVSHKNARENMRKRSSGHLKLSLVGLPINGKQNSAEIINNQTIDDIDIVKQQV